MQSSLLPQHLAEIRTSMKEMIDEAGRIFSYSQQGKPELAEKRIATMDQKYAKLLNSVRRVREDITRIQEKHFQNVMLTSYGERGSSAVAQANGIAAYLTKPVRQSSLFESLARVADGLPDA